MKITNKQKKEVRDYIEYWRHKLFLTQWMFTTGYGHLEGVCAEIKIQSEYKNANITINPDIFFNLEKDEREECIVHELCHCIVHPLVWTS